MYVLGYKDVVLDLVELTTPLEPVIAKLLSFFTLLSRTSHAFFSCTLLTLALMVFILIRAVVFLINLAF